MHSYSQKCQSDQQRLEVDAYQYVFFFSFFFSWTLFIYLNMHAFVQMLLLYFHIL